MGLNPPPTIETGLVLVTQPLLRSDMSRSAEVTYALASTAAPSFADAQAVANAVAGFFTSRFAGLIDSEVSINAPSVRFGDGSTSPFEATSTIAPTNGTNITTYPPPQIAVLLKKNTGLGGRKNRGRMYLPFAVSTSNVSENGTLSSTEVTAMNTAAAGFLSDLTGFDSPMCIANKTFNQPLPPHFVTHVTTGQLVNSLLCEAMVATQRRRLGR